MRKLIIIPAYNEQDNIEATVQDIIENAPEFDYVIINDKSTDSTANICLKNKYNVINLPINLGIGGAMQTGYLYAQKYDYDYAVQFDGDGQHRADYLKNMLTYIQDNNLDMVIGSRFIDNEGFQSSRTRRVGIIFLSNIIYCVSRKKITDPTSGFRIVSKKGIREFCKYYPKDYPEPESVVNLMRVGLKVDEIPVKMRERMGGVSSINLNRSIYYMIKVSLAIVIDALKPKNRKVETEWNLD